MSLTPHSMMSCCCRGLARISKHKSVRFRHIADHLAKGDIDIVTLQEVMSVPGFARSYKLNDNTFCRCGAKTTMLN